MRKPEELSAIIKRRLQSGYPDGELRNDLLKEGYSVEEIDLAFYKASPYNHHPNKQKHIEYPAWFIFSVSSAILGIGLMVEFGASPLSWIILVPGIIGTIIWTGIKVIK